MKIKASIFAIICTICFISPFALTAQEGEVYVSIGGGASIPLLEYAAIDFDQESSGFAKTGGNFNITFGYRFNEFFSLTGILNGCVNRYDYVKLQDWLTQEFALALPNTNWIVESKNWGLGGLMVGPTGSIPLITNKLFMDARFLGGILFAYSPAVYITGKEQGEEDKKMGIEQSNAPSWVVDAGAGFRWNRSRNQYFILMADYMFAQPYFSDVHINTNLGLTRDNAYTQRVSTINISVGIGYIIN